jgi:hypothetical protein
MQNDERDPAIKFPEGNARIFSWCAQGESLLFYTLDEWENYVIGNYGKDFRIVPEPYFGRVPAPATVLRNEFLPGN